MSLRAAPWPLAAVCAALATSVAVALPDGAPWGSANPQASEHCGSCHFGYDAETDSAALRISGIPALATPGKTYELEIGFSDPAAVVAGFQLLATAGEFAATAEHIEYLGAAVRSTRSFGGDGAFSWTVSWTAPESPGAQITIYVAAVGGNDDLSPFGDRAYFRSFETSL